MKKAYLKPDMVVMLVQQTQMLCSSTVINPGGPNMPAGAREFDDWDEDVEEEDVEDLLNSGCVWDE